MPDTPPGADVEWLKRGPIRPLPEWKPSEMDVPNEQGQLPDPRLVELSRLDHERERRLIESFPLIPEAERDGDAKWADVPILWQGDR